MVTPQEMEERRQSERFPILMKAAVLFGADIVEATIFDVSANGAKVRLDCDTLPAAATVNGLAVLQIPEIGNFTGQIVWTDEEYLGLSFFESVLSPIDRRMRERSWAVPFAQYLCLVATRGEGDRGGLE